MLSRSHSFTADVLKLVTGTTLAQIVVVLASPLLTRLYGPEAFGFLALFTSITSIIGVLVCMRYELAIMLPKTEREAVNLLALSLISVVVVSGLTLLALFFAGNTLLSLLKAPGLAPYLILIPPFVFINGIFLALNYWNSRTRQYGRLSVARVTNSLTTTGTQLETGIAGYATGGSLISANLVGSLVSTAVLGGQIWRDDRTLLSSNLSWREILAGLKRYKKFPLFDSLSALLDAVSWQLPVLLLAAFFSPVIVGFYALGFRILQFPMSLIGSAIAQVFFQRAAEAHKSGDLAFLVQNTLTVLLRIIVFPMLILAVVGPDIFVVVFGEEWGEAGIYIQILSVWALFWFLYSPISTIYVVLEKQKFGLIFNVFNILTCSISLLIGGMMGNVFIGLTLFSLSGTAVYGAFCLLLVNRSGVALEEIVQIFVRAFAYSIPGLCILLLIRFMTASHLIVVLTSVILIVVYYVAIYMVDPQMAGIISRS